MGMKARSPGGQWITRQGQEVYELVYHGGLVKP